MFCKPGNNRSSNHLPLAACLLLWSAFGLGCAGDAHASENPAAAIEPPARAPVCVELGLEGGQVTGPADNVLADASVEIPEGALPGAVEIAFLPADAKPEEIAMPCVFVGPIEVSRIARRQPGF